MSGDLNSQDVYEISTANVLQQNVWKFNLNASNSKWIESQYVMSCELSWNAVYVIVAAKQAMDVSRL